MEITFRPITEIKPYQRNAKTHSSEQIRKIADSISEFGFNQPIVLDKDGTVIVGHGRLEAAKLLGLSDVPTVIIELPPAKAKAYRLADNKLSESDWNLPLVIEELKELDLSGLDIELTGFKKELFLGEEAEPMKESSNREQKPKNKVCPECGFEW